MRIGTRASALALAHTVPKLSAAESAALGRPMLPLAASNFDSMPTWSVSTISEVESGPEAVAAGLGEKATLTSTLSPESSVPQRGEAGLRLNAAGALLARRMLRMLRSPDAVF